MRLFRKTNADVGDPATDRSESGGDANSVEVTSDASPAPYDSDAGQQPSADQPIAHELANPTVIDGMLEAVTAIGTKVDQLADRRDLENRMYEDLLKLRERDDVERSLPLFRSVIQVIDRVQQFQQGEHDLAAALREIEEELGDLLERSGIERIERSETDGFEKSLQKSIGNLDPDSDAELKIVDEGYSYRGRILRPQHVMVRPTLAGE